MSESKWREAVAEALYRSREPLPPTDDDRTLEEFYADALLASPVLAQMKREWQAEALREAAEAMHGNLGSGLVIQWLRDRAEASGREGER